MKSRERVYRSVLVSSFLFSHFDLSCLQIPNHLADVDDDDFDVDDVDNDDVDNDDVDNDVDYDVYNLMFQSLICHNTIKSLTVSKFDQISRSCIAELYFFALLIGTTMYHNVSIYSRSMLVEDGTLVY